MKGCKFKLIIILILISIMLFVSCTPKVSEGPNINKNRGKEQKNLETLDENDIEPDISHISIGEDNKLTANLKEKGHIDYFLRDKELVKYSEKITNFSAGNWNTKRTFQTLVPTVFNVSLMYNKYLMPYDYLLVTSESVSIYDSPSLNSKIVGEGKMFDKIQLVNEVEDNWYGVSFYDSNGKIVQGFIPSSSGDVRTFRFQNMYNVIKRLEDELAKNKHGYISNYKDTNGSPPLLNGKAIDNYGMQAYQSAPAYSNLNDLNNFRYFPDGMMVFILGEVKGYFKVKCIEYEGEYWVPKKYISFDNNLDRFAKCVVVDTTNQNQVAFEKMGSKWTLVSYTLATTGVKGKRKYETPIGYFKVMDKKERFYYVDDNTNEVTGYAPYGVRFTQGAYIHGVPVEFKIINGKKTDPGIKEYLHTIGTVPRSHKCVRNFTSHAKFLYNWTDSNDTVIIVIK
ncbi:L,D-transpeptidase [Anaerosalibacter sp. Marseille-P3206]|uniref:L,D-transpeptidase n=1 Tax=Anaerosalibacter sp. Marseille-P3206 TaxID=1871005 RepID=UPI0009863AA7|nr:L,D-transpeptidase family protein [Anaerosalibacter sp. Marseille-P3206]